MREIPGYPGYKITEDGTVYSFRVGNSRKVRATGRLVRGIVNNLSRVRVNLYRDGVRCPVSISRLVAQIYIPNPDNLPLVMHKDNNPLNNHYKNLKWGTPSMNLKQCWEEGRNPGNIGMSYQDKIALREAFYQSGMTQAEFARSRGLYPMKVSRILKGPKQTRR